MYRAAGKRCLDITAVILLIPLWVPLWAIAAAAVLMLDGRPAHFRQRRIGCDNQPFTLLKLRTMSVEGGDDASRLTPVGGFLRKASLDELPQLVNVLRGDMSLVGPRPLFIRYLPFYTAEERRRHTVRPGITGLAQTAGRNILTWDERLRLDVDYVDNLSFALDVRILWLTVKATLRGSDVQVIPGAHQPPLDIARGGAE